MLPLNKFTRKYEMKSKVLNNAKIIGNCVIKGSPTKARTRTKTLYERELEIYKVEYESLSGISKKTLSEKNLKKVNNRLDTLYKIIESLNILVSDENELKGLISGINKYRIIFRYTFKII